MLYLFSMVYKIHAMRIVSCDIWRLMNLIPLVILNRQFCWQGADNVSDGLNLCNTFQSILAGKVNFFTNERSCNKT